MLTTLAGATEWQPPEPIDFDTILARLEANTGGSSGTTTTVEILQRIHRPFSDLLRVRIRSDGEEAHLFVKRFKPKAPGQDQWVLARDRVACDYQTSLRVLDFVTERPEFAAVRPIACFPEDLVLVTEALPGETLSRALERCAIWRPAAGELAQLVSVLEKVGAWIRRFQQSDRNPPPLSLAAMREYLDVRLRKIVASINDTFSEKERHQLLAWFDDRAACIPASELLEVPVHADLCPANVLVNANTVAIIDFAMASTGGVYLDLARMYTQLEFMKAKPKFRPQVIAELQAALLRGFDVGLHPDRPLFTLFILQHTVTQLLKLTLRPGHGTARLWNSYLRKRHRRWLSTLISKHVVTGSVAGRPPVVF